MTASAPGRTPIREPIGRTGRTGRTTGERGSVLVIVLWIAFGLVSLALFFAQTMTMEYRAADNRAAALAADQAALGAARYLTNLLARLEVPGRLPAPSTFRCEDVPVGDSAFWILGRPDALDSGQNPVFGLVDEAAKLNLNSASAAMLELLPRMTTELAAAIVDWRDTDSDVTEGGAEDESYLQGNPGYHCKNGPFESVEELRLVRGMSPEILYGEDPNQNGVLDPNENDGDESPPADDRDGQLDPGLIEFLTVHSREPSLRTNGMARIDVASTNQTELATLLEEKFGADRANTILRTVGFGTGGTGGTGGAGGPGGTGAPGGGGPPGGGTGGGGGTGVAAPTYGSLLEFYQATQMTAEEFSQIEADLTAGTNGVAGPVNVNTASETVLACIPGIGVEKAATLVAQRRTSAAATTLPSVAWVAEVLDQTALAQAGRYLTGQSYQFTADIAAVGPRGRGYRRVRYTISAENGVPRFLARRDLTDFGWALGREVRTALATPEERLR